MVTQTQETNIIITKLKYFIHHIRTITNLRLNVLKVFSRIMVAVKFDLCMMSKRQNMSKRNGYFAKFSLKFDIVYIFSVKKTRTMFYKIANVLQT